MPLFPVKPPLNLPNCSIRPVVHLCVAPCPLQVLRYVRSPSVRLFPLKRSLPEARSFPRCHRPVAASAWSAPVVLSPSPSSFGSPPSLQCLESLLHVSQAFVFFSFSLSEYISYFLKFYFIVVSTLALRSMCHTALLTVGARLCRSPELTPCLTLFLDPLLCFAVRNV